MPNMNKLKGKILEQRLTYMECAEELGVSKATFSSKINKKTETGFSVTEAYKLSNLLQLTNEEKLTIFFGN